MVRFISFWSLFFVSSLIFFLIPLEVSAQGKTGTLDVNPAYREVDLEKASEEKSFEIVYRNNSSKSIGLDISAIDFKQRSEQGGLMFLGEQEEGYSYSLSSFLTFHTDHLQIEPNSEEPLQVTIKNRQDLSPGGHYAAVIAKIAPDTQQENVVLPAVSSLIFMRKMGGERFNISIRSVDWPNELIAFGIPKRTQLVFQNEGNIHVVPYGRAEIKDMFGRLVYKGILNTSSAIVMPETRRLISIDYTPISWMLPISFNSLRISGSDSLKKTSYIYRESFLYIHPFAAVFLLVIPGVFILRKKRKKR